MKVWRGGQLLTLLKVLKVLKVLKTPASLFAKPLSLFVSVPNFGDQNFAFL